MAMDDCIKLWTGKRTMGLLADTEVGTIFVMGQGKKQHWRRFGPVGNGRPTSTRPGEVSVRRLETLARHAPVDAQLDDTVLEIKA